MLEFHVDNDGKGGSLTHCQLLQVDQWHAIRENVICLISQSVADGLKLLDQVRRCEQEPCVMHFTEATVGINRFNALKTLKPVSDFVSESILIDMLE